MNKALTLLGGIINFIALGYYGTVDRFAPAILAYFSEDDEEVKWRHHLQILMTLSITSAAMKPGHNNSPTQFSTTMADEYAVLKQMLQQQLKLMEALTAKLSNSSMG
ncbi:hypothetical protein SprV_0100215400 [Sparganum proliferum]